jgi:TolB-like protein
MSATDSQPLEPSDRRRPTVFLSYASEDRRAAQILRDALPAYGLEVWYDESDLIGGDAWDQKIRRQIRECDYFMPVISAHTEARHEGYFRREWRLAVERTLDMADDHTFLLPVAIDATAEAGARVPERFRAVQWLRLPGGQPSAALEALCRRLVAGSPEEQPPVRKSREPPAGRRPPRRHYEFPAFPREEPGQRIRFGFQVAGWALQSSWVAFSRVPRWARIGIYCWLAVLLMSRGCSSSDEHRHAPPRISSAAHPYAPPRISSPQAQALRHIGQSLGVSHPGPWTAADTAQLISQIAKAVPTDTDDSTAYAPVLAIPFAAPADDGAARKLARSAFGQMYGQLAIARHGRVALADEPLPILDPSVATVMGRAHHSTYIVYGAIDGNAPDLQLTVKVIAVDDGSVKWSKSYPVAGADAGRIAEEVSSKVPSSEDDD